MPTLLFHLLQDIVSKARKTDFRSLSSFIFAGCEGHNVAASTMVLKAVNINEFLASPTLINEGSNYRKLFFTCMDAKNPTAMYLEGLRKVYVGESERGITFLKFVYNKESGMVIGDDHGNKTPLEVKELELEYPREYITSVEGCYDKELEVKSELYPCLCLRQINEYLYHLDSNLPQAFYSTKKATKLLDSMENQVT